MPTVAWEAVKAAREIAHHGAGLETEAAFEDLLDCAVRACGRSSEQPGSRPVTAAASA